VSTYKTCFATVEIDLISILKLYLGYLGNDKVVFISFVFDMFHILKKSIFHTNSFVTHEIIIVLLSLFIFVYFLFLELFHIFGLRY